MPTETIDGVVGRMEAIEAGLPSSDGVACFTRLYLSVTRAVRADTRNATFADEPYMARLDVVFADLFFTAYSDWARKASCPPAWRPLFAHRGRSGTAPIRFALAGMNAHINHDLPLAIVHTCKERSVAPADDSPQHADFERVNAILGQVEKRIKRRFETGALAEIDRVASKEDDAVAMWSIAEARSVAWKHARTLWHLQGHPRLVKDYEEALAGLVDLGGRGILL